MDVKFTRGSRKHKIGRASARYVIGNAVPSVQVTDRGQSFTWIGFDERGRELEVVAVIEPRDGALLVIHVMPTAFRKGGSSG